MPLFSCVEPAPTDPARNQVERILTLAALLPIALQPVFAAWLGRHSGGDVSNPSKTTLFRWLAGMDTDRAQAEYQLILTEIAWLELVTDSSQVHALQKEAL
jgi:hypothetical protein